MEECKRRAIARCEREQIKWSEMVKELEAKELDLNDEAGAEKTMNDIRKLHARIENIRAYLAAKGMGAVSEKAKYTGRASKTSKLKFKGSGFSELDQVVTKFVNQSWEDNYKRKYSAEDGNNYTELFSIPNGEIVSKMILELQSKDPALFPVDLDLDELARRTAKDVAKLVRKRRVQDRRDMIKDFEETFCEQGTSTAGVLKEDADLKERLRDNAKLAEENTKKIKERFAHIPVLDQIKDTAELPENLAGGSLMESEACDDVDDELLDTADDMADLIDRDSEEGSGGSTSPPPLPEQIENGQQLIQDEVDGSGESTSEEEEEEEEVVEDLEQIEQVDPTPQYITVEDENGCSDDNEHQPETKKIRLDVPDDVITLD